MKKILKNLVFLAGIFAPAAAFAVTSTITFSLPGGFIATLWSSVQTLFDGISDYTNTILGVVLVGALLEILIGTLHRPGK